MAPDPARKTSETAAPENITALLLAAEQGDRSALQACFPLVYEEGGNPAVGVPGVISADTPTNIYFFIAGWR